jgi:hypothetical protein
MKTKLINGTRTPEVVYNELRKTCRLVAIREDEYGFIHHYYYNENLTPLVMEVTIKDDRAVAIRKLTEEATRVIIPDFKGIKAKDPNQDFTFGGF